MRILPPLALALACTATPLLAENFTTAAEVKPILTATKAGWIAVREYDGNDLVYFTQIEAWRCGLTSIRYAINGNTADMDYEMEACHEGEATPNALKMEGHLPYIVQPLDSVKKVTVEITYDDGTTDSATYQRDAVLMH